MDDLQDAARAFYRLALERSGLSAYKLAGRAGISPTTITRPLNDPTYKFVPKLETMAKIADAAGIELPDVLRSPAAAIAAPEAVGRSIPVVGEVRAGSWEAIPDEEDVNEWLQMNVPEYAGAQLFALRVVGRSMDLVYPEGTYVIACPPAEAGVREGDRVVVRRYDAAGRAETTLKEVLRGNDGVIVLQPRSSDLAHQIPIIVPVNRDENADDGVSIIGVVVAHYRTEGRGRGPLLSV